MSRRQILILFLAFFATLTAATYVVLFKTDATRTFVRQLISRTIREDLFQLSTAELDIAAGTLTLKDLKIKDPGSEKETLLSIDRVDVEVDMNPLGEVGAVRGIRLLGLEIHLNLAKGEILDLGNLLEQAGVKDLSSAKPAAIPAITITDSLIHIRVADDRPVITCRIEEMTVLPLETDPTQVELSGKVTSPQGHPFELQGRGNIEKQEFRVLLVGRDIPIQARQAAVFRDEAALFLDAANVSGMIKRMTAWVELRAADENVGNGGNGTGDTERFRAGVSAEFENLSVTPPQFPYAITKAKGTLICTRADNGTIKLFLEKKAVDGDVTLRATASHCLLGKPQCDLELEVEDLLIGSRIRDAIDGSEIALVRELDRAIAVTAGRIDAKVQLFNNV